MKRTTKLVINAPFFESKSFSFLRAMRATIASTITMTFKTINMMVMMRQNLRKILHCLMIANNISPSKIKLPKLEPIWVPLAPKKEAISPMISTATKNPKIQIKNVFVVL
uniref:Uncharacterized protein n=1 Tax=Opuntia streptacantha TaxID=393608 RepID=A0A7C8ZH27_OPUST